MVLWYIIPDELLSFTEESDNLTCTTCNPTFATEANRGQHVCKGVLNANDLISVA
jgi:hypothetical protein